MERKRSHVTPRPFSARSEQESSFVAEFIDKHGEGFQSSPGMPQCQTRVPHARRSVFTEHGGHPAQPDDLRQQPERKDQEGWCVPSRASAIPDHLPIGRGKPGLTLISTSGPSLAADARARIRPASSANHLMTDPPRPTPPRITIHRAEEVAAGHLQPVRQDHRHRRREVVQAPRAGVGGLRRRGIRHRGHARHAGLPVLRQAHAHHVREDQVGRHGETRGFVRSQGEGSGDASQAEGGVADRGEGEPGGQGGTRRRGGRPGEDPHGPVRAPQRDSLRARLARGDDGGDVVHVVSAISGFQGGAHGGGQTRDRVRGVRDGHAGVGGAVGAPGVQDQPHALHDARVRRQVIGSNSVRRQRCFFWRWNRPSHPRGVPLVVGHCTRRAGTMISLYKYSRRIAVVVITSIAVLGHPTRCFSKNRSSRLHAKFTWVSS